MTEGKSVLLEHENKESDLLKESKIGQALSRHFSRYDDLLIERQTQDKKLPQSEDL